MSLVEWMIKIVSKIKASEVFPGSLFTFVNFLILCSGSIFKKGQKNTETMQAPSPRKKQKPMFFVRQSYYMQIPSELQDKYTEIYYDQSDAPMQIRMHDLNLIRRLTALSSDYPEICRLVETDQNSGAYFEEMDKSRVSIHVTKPYSAERRRKQSEWVKEYGVKGNIKL